jgi:CoA:oxalate CoA-transferase
MNATGAQTDRPHALAGIRVLALEGFIAGPYASMWLADMGAEVIKIEEPGTGDPARSLPPLRGDGPRRSLSLLRASRNKKSLTLDLKTPEGLAIFDRLVATSDVVIENLRADALQRLGLTYERMAKINPRIIYTSISGFGHDDVMPGPYTDWPAFDVIGQAMAGLMFRPEGATERPAYLGFPVADLYAATVAVCGTLQALFQRVVTGEGQRVDIAMFDTALVLNELALVLQTSLGVTSAAGLHALTAPFGAYRAKDGFISIAVLGERVWQRFCEALAQPDLMTDPTLANGVERHRQSARLTALIEAWLGERTREAAANHLRSFGVPAAPIRNVGEIVDCPQVSAREMLMSIEDPAWGTVRVVGQPIKTSGSAPPPRNPPPDLGQHTEALLHDLAGIDEGEFTRLRSRGIV